MEYALSLCFLDSEDPGSVSYARSISILSKSSLIIYNTERRQ
jgi:hypothetical protein